MGSNVNPTSENLTKFRQPDYRISWFTYFFSWLNWVQTSMQKLEIAESRLLKLVKTTYTSGYIDCPSGNQIWTVKLNEAAKSTPLVMVHGMGSGVGLWLHNLDFLAKNRPVYCFDVLGFGRSSRPTFSKDAIICEREFVHSLEEWRQQLRLEKFILLGHSLGGFIASSYAREHGERVKHLILIDPWGFPEEPAANGDRRRSTIPLWVRAIGKVMINFNPLAVLRVAGPWGPSLVRRFRPDLGRKFGAEEEHVYDYIYHCNVQSPSGETAFKTMLSSFGWAKNPMIRRVNDLEPSLGMTMIYGAKSWVDSSTGFNVKYLRKDSDVHVEVIRGAGHHVYADRPDEFNALVDEVCSAVDQTAAVGGKLNMERPITPTLNGAAAAAFPSYAEEAPISLSDAIIHDKPVDISENAPPPIVQTCDASGM